MLFSRCVLLILFCTLLQGCVSPRMSQEMVLGKIHFSDGNYKRAFRELLPVAVYGRPEAQYAVGYMYYYGYGAARDSESGIFWMTKAAEKRYVPAIRALEMICENKSYCPADLVKEEAYRHAKEIEAREMREVREVRQRKEERKEERDVVLESIKRPSPYRPTPAPMANENIEPYVLQLFGAFKVEDVKGIQRELNLKEKTRIWHAKNQGKDWYVLTLGEYDSVVEARVAKNKLPREVKELDPWIRKMNGLEPLSRPLFMIHK